MTGRVVVLAATVVLVAGCAPKGWNKAGASYDSFMVDSRACAADATVNRPTQASGSFGVGGGFQYSDKGPDIHKDIYRSCLRARGYAYEHGGPFAGFK